MQKGTGTLQRFVALTAAFVVFFSLACVVLANDEKAIDWQRAKELLQKQQRGEKLTEAESAYLERAK
ncbi:MAG: hypothetical protein ABIF19_02295, partial [Planctomycetota bacterium]